MLCKLPRFHLCGVQDFLQLLLWQGCQMVFWHVHASGIEKSADFTKIYLTGSLSWKTRYFIRQNHFYLNLSLFISSNFKTIWFPYLQKNICASQTMSATCTNVCKVLNGLYIWPPRDSACDGARGRARGRASENDRLVNAHFDRPHTALH